MANWTIKDGDFCFVEIPADDTDLAKDFYGKLFGWKYEAMPGMDYTMITTSEDGVLAGFGQLFESKLTARLALVSAKATSPASSRQTPTSGSAPTRLLFAWILDLPRFGGHD
jgi:hypothetical protein